MPQQLTLIHLMHGIPTQQSYLQYNQGSSLYRVKQIAASNNDDKFKVDTMGLAEKNYNCKKAIIVSDLGSIVFLCFLHHLI